MTAPRQPTRPRIRQPRAYARRLSLLLGQVLPVDFDDETRIAAALLMRRQQENVRVGVLEWQA
mgnify:CR=1 FL=1